jgi:hypothetical protein
MPPCASRILRQLAEKLLAFDTGSCGEGADIADSAIAVRFRSHIKDCRSVSAVVEKERLYDNLRDVPCIVLEWVLRWKHKLVHLSRCLQIERGWALILVGAVSEMGFVLPSMDSDSLELKGRAPRPCRLGHN